MQPIHVYNDIDSFAYFWWKIAVVTRNQVVCHVINIFFWVFIKQGITVTSFIIVGYVRQVLGMGEGLFAHPSSMSSPKKAHPE